MSYLNTKPLIYGFEKGMMKDEVDLVIDYPSKIGSMLLKNEIDVGLVPVAIIPEMEQHYIVSDYCIGSEGEVASVCLFSEVPLDKIEKILLDYQSRTSVVLLKILIKEHWKLNVVFENTTGNYESQICGTTAGLVIGDRAFSQRMISPFIYDLGLEWKSFTGLPFVFAAWVSNKKLDDNFSNLFNEANKYGLDNLEEVTLRNHCNTFDLNEYFNSCISFNFTTQKNNGLNLFLSMIPLNKR